ncbi:hypothetical protein AB4519_19185 [Vibrio splendidus]
MDISETNNPTVDELLMTYQALDTIGLIDENLKKEASVLKVIQKFNCTFKDEAWALNDYLSFTCCSSALEAAENGNVDNANEVLVEGVSEGIELFISHLVSAKEFNERKELLVCARDLYLQGNHCATVPLLLIALDGISNDIMNLGLFAQNSNLEVWDSLTQYDEALSYIQKNFLTKNRTQTNLEEINLPYRNGILHGRDVNFANPLVSAKCWNVLFVLRTWYRDKKDESYKQDLYQKRTLQKSENDTFAYYLDKFYQLNKLTSESDNFDVLNVATGFLEGWKHCQWGKIVPFMHHLVGKHRGEAAGEVKDTYHLFWLESYEIIDISHDTPSSAVIKCELSVSKDSEVSVHNISLRLNYSSGDLLPLPAGHPEGKWGVVQNSLSEILF